MYLLPTQPAGLRVRCEGTYSRVAGPSVSAAPGPISIPNPVNFKFSAGHAPNVSGLGPISAFGDQLKKDGSQQAGRGDFEGPAEGEKGRRLRYLPS